MSRTKALFGKKAGLYRRPGSTLLSGFIPIQPLLQNSNKNNQTPQINSYLSYGLALARTSLGAVAYLAPTIPSVPWVGKKEASTHAVHLFARTLGARDFALGLGHLYSLINSEDTRKWLLAGAVADLGDTIATVIDFKKLPKPYAYGVLALTVSACATGIYLSAVDK
jgi:hypothetical protein